MKQHKNRLIVDLCTPTRERRPTTMDDLEDDILVEDFDNSSDLIERLKELNYFDDEDIEDEVDLNNKKEVAEYLLGFLTDPGDGSPNVLYCCVDGEECSEAYPYYCLKLLNLDKATRREIIDEIAVTFCD